MHIKGIDELGKTLDDLSRNAEKLSKTKSASLTDVFTADFVSRHTKFADADDLFKASGFNVSTQAAFEAIPEEKLDSFIAASSSFLTWRDMLNAAGAEWAKRQLGL